MSMNDEMNDGRNDRERDQVTKDAAGLDEAGVRELERIAAAFAISDPQESDRTSDEERTVVELLGALPAELDPVEPPVRVKQKLFAQLGIGLTGDAGSVDPTDRSESPSVAHVVRDGDVGDVVPFRAPAPQPRWVGLLAAAAVLMAVGLAALSGVFYAQLSQQSDLIGALESELADRADADNASGDSLAQVRHELNEVRQRLGVFTSPDTRVCRLASRDAAQPGATGAVFMRDGGGWVLTARNLQKCKLGREYRVWFVTEDGKLNGGSFFVKDEDTRVEIGADELPQGTIGVMITLEYPGEAEEEPAGPTVLFGDESREML